MRFDVRKRGARARVTVREAALPTNSRRARSVAFARSDPFGVVAREVSSGRPTTSGSGLYVRYLALSRNNILGRFPP